jgi:hypothetical protein
MSFLAFGIVGRRCAGARRMNRGSPPSLMPTLVSARDWRERRLRNAWQHAARNL